MGPRRLKDLIEESEAELDAHQAEQEEQQDPNASREGEALSDTTAASSQKAPKKRASALKPQAYERTSELTEVMGSILRTIAIHIRRHGIPEDPEEADLDLPEGVTLEDIRILQQKIKCPEPAKECKTTKYADYRVHLRREETRVTISYLLRHLLGEHNFNESLIPIHPKGPQESFRDLVFVLLNDKPTAKKKKKTTPKKKTATKKKTPAPAPKKRGKKKKAKKKKKASSPASLY